MDQELWHTQRANDVTRAARASGQPAGDGAYPAAGVRHGRHLKNRTSYQKSSIDAYLLEEHFCQISSRCDLKRRSLRLFLQSIAATRQRTTR